MRRRGWRRALGHGQVELNVIPLIDVVFFLLVFYVISTSFVSESAIGVQRPQSERAATVHQGYLAVTVVRSGAIHIGERVVELGATADAVASALAHDHLERVVIIADREVTLAVLTPLMDACVAGGAKDVALAAIREAR